MENDSLNMAVDSAGVAAGSGASLDSGAVVGAEGALDSGAVAPAMPTPEQLGISVTAGPAGGMPAITVGDTFEFPVTVSWSVQGSALLVVPAGSANAKGLTQVGLSQESSRSVKDGKEIASITFTYKIAAQDTGNLHIPALRFEIPTQMGQPIDLRSESVDVRVEEPFNPLPIAVGAVVALCVLFAGLWRAKRRAAAREAVATKNAAQEALRERMMVLKQRVNVADSREWLLELESIAKEFVFEKFGADVGSGKDGGSGLNSGKDGGSGLNSGKDGGSGLNSGKDGAGGSAAGFESAASVNLDALVKEGRLEGWETIVEEFAHARYGGGKRDGFENRETWKAAMRLMGIEE